MAETWATWLQDRIPPKMRHDMQQQAETEQDQEVSQAADKADAAWAKQMNDQALANQMEYTTGHTAEERYQIAMRGQAAKGERDVTAEYGSATRAEVIITGAGGELVRLQPREEASGAVTVRADSDQAQLARARANPPKGREFMQRQVAELERRQRDAGRPVISRSQTPDTIQCLDCIADGNVTVDEYLELHHGPDAIPERLVPDHAPASRKRPGADRRTPMIYR
jgi:hypothetical protein